MNKPYLADVMPLPVHPTWRHPITDAPIQALGVRRNGAPIWPVMGGSQPLGGPAPGAAQPQQQGQFGGQQPAGQFGPGLGGQPVPVFAPGALPMGPPAPQPQQPGMFPAQQFAQFGQQQFGPQQYGPPGYGPQQYAQPQYGQQFGQQQFGQPAGVTPPQPYTPALPGQQPPFPAPPVGQPGQPAGPTAQPGVQQGQQPQGQQPQGGGQQTGNDGTWDRPYPQGVPLEQMNDQQKVEFWKYHSRQNENKLRQFADYDQVKQQLQQLQQMTQTEWQRAVLDAESRGESRAMERAGGQMVAVAFQGAAQTRMSADQIQAQLNVLDPRRFIHGGQVDIAAIQAYVDTIAPPRQASGMVPLIPPAQPGQYSQLPLQQVTLGYPGQPGQQGPPLQPGQPGYAQQPTFGPINPQQHGWQQPVGQVPGQQVQQPYGQVVNGQVVGQQTGYGPIPIPGVPAPYQPAAQVPQPVVQAAGLYGLPSLSGQNGLLPAATDFGQGPAVPGAPASALQSGSAMAAARHGKTRTQQLAVTRGA